MRNQRDPSRKGTQESKGKRYILIRKLSARPEDLLSYFRHVRAYSERWVGWIFRVIRPPELSRRRLTSRWRKMQADVTMRIHHVRLSWVAQRPRSCQTDIVVPHPVVLYLLGTPYIWGNCFLARALNSSVQLAGSNRPRPHSTWFLRPPFVTIRVTIDGSRGYSHMHVDDECLI